MANPKPKFMLLGKSKFVHVVHTEAYDRKNSECMTVRKYMVAEKIDYKGKGMSASAAAALDPCPNCDTAGVIKAQESPEERKARAADAKAETMAKIKDSTATKAQRNKGKPKKAPTGSDRSTRRTGGGSKRLKVSAGNGGDLTREKAEALAAFGVEHGWDADVREVKGEHGLLMRATKGEELIQCWFVDGKYDTARHATLTVGSWTGKLRGVHGCRKQMAGEGRERPHPSPGQGRARKTAQASKREKVTDDSPIDAKHRLPFKMDDDEEKVLAAVLGKRIKWRNSISGGIEEAWMPKKAEGKNRTKVSITTHPKTGKRMISFLTVLSVSSDEDGVREQYGPERSVYLDKITKVV